MTPFSPTPKKAILSRKEGHRDGVIEHPGKKEGVPSRRKAGRQEKEKEEPSQKKNKLRMIKKEGRT